MVFEEEQQSKEINVVIVGAGPAGLLTTILLLRRNSSGNNSKQKYRVTLIDPGDDYGKLDEDGLNRARSWMIGLSAHGLDAIQQVDGLYDDYVHGLGIDITKAIFGLSKSRKVELNIKDVPGFDSGNGKSGSFTVDRNYICAALSRYIIDKHESKDDKCYVPLYNTRALFVDGENKVVVARPTKTENNDEYDGKIHYDILLGCDGIRSVVRNAFLTTHRDFEFDLKGTFTYGKSVHVPCPENVDEGTFMFINEALPGGFGSFILPETGKTLNVALGATLADECPSELQSDDPKVVAQYFRDHWHAFDLSEESAMVIGNQWVEQTKWNTISQVHCNFYHSNALNALLLGDAAHATSPQIGQGMNTALADAAALDEMLDANNDDWNVVLPLFSKERVKEGNALTDLSFYTFSLDGKQQFSLLLRQHLRRTFNRYFPWFVDPDPMVEVSRGMKLSEAYNRMTKLGVIPKVRRTNDTIMRKHFEKEVGMVKECENDISNNEGRTMGILKIVSYGFITTAACGAASFLYHHKQRR